MVVGQPLFARNPKAVEQALYNISGRVAEVAAPVVVHRDGGDAGLGGYARDFGLTQETVYVVDQRRAGFDGGPRDFGLVGVDTDGDIEFVAQPRDDRDHAPHFFVR